VRILDKYYFCHLDLMQRPTQHPQLPPTMVPGQHGGFAQSGDVEQRQFPTVTGKRSSRCRILAVCGTNDYAGNAAPHEDGWFFSDFFMLHHLLKPVTEDQTWLTCVKPDILVKKHSRYVQGNPKTDDRRVVLDQDMLPDVADVTYVDEKNLLQHLLQVDEDRSFRLAIESEHGAADLCDPHKLLFGHVHKLA